MSRQAPLLERPELRPTDVTRGEVEDLLFLEAALLDEWRMEEWLELWTEDAEYVGAWTSSALGRISCMGPSFEWLRLKLTWVRRRSWAQG